MHIYMHFVKQQGNIVYRSVLFVDCWLFICLEAKVFCIIVDSCNGRQWLVNPGNNLIN